MKKEILKNNNIDNKKNKRIYLDISSQTMPNKKVLREIKKVESLNFNPANLYDEGYEANKILNEGRLKIARVLGVKEHEIYFTNNSTLSISAVIFGSLNQYKENFFQNQKKIKNKNKNKNKNKIENLKKDYILPRIITSKIEHEATLKNLEYLKKIGEIELDFIEVDKNGFLKIEDLKNKIQKNTILISIMYVNNEVGIINDLKNISKKILEWKKENQRGLFDFPYFHSDASQAGNYLSLYIDKIGVDMLSLNGSKIYGPKSSAILFKKENIKISPFYFGGGQEREIFSGTIDIEKAIGISIAIEEAQKKILNKNFLENLAEKRNYLLKEILENLKDVKVLAHLNQDEWKENKLGVASENRIPKRLPNNLSLWLPNFPSDEMVLRMNEKGFSISSGSACSAKIDDYSKTIYEIVKNNIQDYFPDFKIKNNNLKNKNENLKENILDKKKIDILAKKIGTETIRISFDESISKEDLKKFVGVLKEIYFKFKKD